MAQGHGIGLLYQATERFDYDVLPSWVPVSCQKLLFPRSLWRKCVLIQCFHYYDLAKSRASGPLRILGCNIKLDFAATGSTSSAIRIFKDQISICAKGAIFDVIINISDEVDFDSSDFSSTHLQAQSRLTPIQ